MDAVFVGNVLSSLISAHDFTTSTAHATALAQQQQQQQGQDLSTAMRRSGAVAHLVEILKSCEDGYARRD
jgi:hypothetical protein